MVLHVGLKKLMCVLKTRVNMITVFTPTLPNTPTGSLVYLDSKLPRLADVAIHMYFGSVNPMRLAIPVISKA